MGVLRFILTHAVFIALCAVALTMQTNQLLQYQHNYWLYGFVFFATLCSYNFHLLTGAFTAKAGEDRSIEWQRHSTTLLFIIIAAAGMGWMLLHLKEIWLFIALAFIATAAYTIALLPIPTLQKIRQLGFIKTILLAGTWTFVTTCLPMAFAAKGVGENEIVFTLHRFVFVLQICYIFDLRDKKIDKVRGLHSLVTDIPPGIVNFVFYGFVAVFLLLTGFLHTCLDSTGYTFCFLFVQVFAFILYQLSQQQRSYLFYYFLVDGLLLLSPLLTYLAAV